MTLFKGIVRDDSNANIGWINNKSVFYEEGYKLAAEKLASEYPNLYINEKDSLIFPIIFLYRQYLELSLKSIIRRLDLILTYSRKDKILGRHKLLELWDEASRQYAFFLKDNSVSLVFTNASAAKERKVIIEFNKFDEDSFSFRYSTDKKGNENLQGIDYISLNNFKSQIALVVKHLDGVNETIAHFTDLQGNNYYAE